MDTLTQRRWRIGITIAAVALVVYGYGRYRATREEPQITRNTFYTASGVEVTTLVDNDTRMLNHALGGHLWKFDIARPPQGYLLFVTPELRQSGKRTAFALSYAFPPPGEAGVPPDKHNIHLQFGVMPIGRTVADSAQIRVFLIGDGMAVYQIVPNPFKGTRYGGFPGEPLPDGALLLLSVGKNGIVTSIQDQNDLELVLQLKQVKGKMKPGGPMPDPGL